MSSCKIDFSVRKFRSGTGQNVRSNPELSEKSAIVVVVMVLVVHSAFGLVQSLALIFALFVGNKKVFSHVENGGLDFSVLLNYI